MGRAANVIKQYAAYKWLGEDPSEPEQPYPILFLVNYMWHQGQQILYNVRSEYRSRSPLKVGDHIKYIATDQKHIKTLQGFFDSNGYNATVVDLEQVKNLEQELRSAFASGR